MKGLAGYEIFKTGAFLVLMTCILFCVVELLRYDIKLRIFILNIQILKCFCLNLKLKIY